MSFEGTSMQVLKQHEQTEQLLDYVRRAADENKTALGFLPASVYHDISRKDCLYVLIDDGEEDQQYAGHLLFTLRYPVATVIQMHIEPRYRRQGHAAKLVEYFCEELTQIGFTSVYAGVAEDLTTANKFWEAQKFHVQAVRRGGESRKRKILRRCRELDSPQLVPPSGIGQNNPLGLSAHSAASISLFLLDLNVLFDVTGPRRERHMVAVSLFQAERQSICSLAISNEAREELHRTATKGRVDPMEGFIDILPSFPLKKYALDDLLFKELTSIVFPRKEILTENDKSDLRHLATAIEHELAGLITNDTSLLNAGRSIQRKYGVEVLSPETFEAEQMEQHNNAFESKGALDLILKRVDEQDISQFHSFLRDQRVSSSEVATQWLPTGGNSRVVSRFGIWAENRPVGFITWSSSGQQGHVIARVATNCESDVSDDAARILLMALLDGLMMQGTRKVDLIMPQHQSVTREIATSLGFRGEPNASGLHKVVLGGVVTADSWAEFRSQLLEKGAIKLPEHIPEFQSSGQLIDIITPDGNRRFIPLDDLESLLSPALLCLPGRNTVITPIQKSFSEPLLGHSHQATLLPAARVSVFRDRHYISSSRTLPLFKRGTLMFFYESGKNKGRSSIVAVARVRQAYLRRAEDIGLQEFEQSVLDSQSVDLLSKSKMKTVTVFDNCFVLPYQVPLKSLQRLGCGASTQLQTTNTITADQADDILREAYRYGC